MPFRVFPYLLLIFATTLCLEARILHVNGSSSNPEQTGEAVTPFKTINQAAEAAMPGDTVLIHEGIYREFVRPVRGGTEENPIVYKAAPREAVVVKGSEIVTDWQIHSGNVYKTSITPELVGDYNPFAIHPPLKSERVLGQVFHQGEHLTEVFSLEDVANKSMSWTASEDGSTVYANFGEAGPVSGKVELAVREQIFSPSVYNLGYIHIDGITFEHCANNYPHLKYKADGGVPEKGAVSTAGGHDWIIQNCTIRYSKTLAIDFGIQGIKMVIDNGFEISSDRDLYYEIGRIGHHIIRNNLIEYAGDGALVAYWSAFCRLENNVIRNSNHLNFGGLATAAIKVLLFINGVIENNYLHDNDGRYIWVDNGYQGSRITGNVLVDDKNRMGIWSEMGHGPLLIDNNVFIRTYMQNSDGGGVVVAHNLFVDSKEPAWKSYSANRHPGVYDPVTAKRLSAPKLSNDHFWYFNNVFVEKGLDMCGGETCHSDFNVFLDGASGTGDPNELKVSSAGQVSLNETNQKLELTIDVPEEMLSMNAPAISPDFVGEIPPGNYKIETITKDFIGNVMPESPVPGPFQNLSVGSNTLVLRNHGEPTTFLQNQNAQDKKPKEQLNLRYNPLNQTWSFGSQVYDLQGKSVTGD